MRTTDHSAVLAIARWGRGAAAFAQHNASAPVAAVFQRSVHVVAGDELICIGTGGIGNGPINAIVDRGAEAMLAQAIGCGIGCRVTLEGKRAQLWQAPLPPPFAGVHHLGPALAALRDLLVQGAADDGLAGLVIADGADETSALARLAGPRIARLRHWLEDGACEGSAPPVELVGLGPGLTPSGDDLICGVLVTLAACGHGAKARRLGAAACEAAARGATSQLSGAMLRAAAEGEAGEALHVAVNAMLGGSLFRVAPALEAAAAVGHSSGRDGLAGIWLALTTCPPCMVEGRRHGGMLVITSEERDQAPPFALR